MGLVQAHNINGRFLIQKKKKIKPASEHQIGDKRTKNPLPVNALADESPRRESRLRTPPTSIRKPCQISSSLVFAAKRDGSQKMQPASSSAIIRESALKGRLSIIAYNVAIIFHQCFSSPALVASTCSSASAVMTPNAQARSVP